MAEVREEITMKKDWDSPLQDTCIVVTLCL
nr:MAG TPA: hypothetical protein [Caudoviricetes sp.]